MTGRPSCSLPWATIVASAAATILSIAPETVRAQAATSSGFVPGGRQIYALDVASTATGGMPKDMTLLRGKLAVVTKDGSQMLKASEPTEVLIRLPEVLPEAFTLEFDIIPKACCAPEDISFEGTPTIARSATSAHVSWNTTTLIVVGGGEYFQIPTPEDLAETLVSAPTHVNVSIDASRLKFYLNDREVANIPGRKFARGRVLRVSLGGTDEDDHAVFLSRLRIAESKPGVVALAGQPSPAPGATTATAVPVSPTTTATGMTSAAPVNAVPATSTATGSTISPTPIATAPTAPVTVSSTAAPPGTRNPAIDPGSLLVGAGMSDITGPITEVVMMGYADGKQKAAGLHTRLHARAFIFASSKTNKRVVWVNTELGMMFSSVKQGVIKKLGAKYGTMYTDENVMLSATHTHSGPGGYSHYALYNISIGGFVRQNYDAIVDGITEAIVQAHNRLAPGSVSIASHDLVDQTTVNRSKIAFVLNPEALAIPAASAVNRDMTLLKLLSGGRPIGAIAFHAVHNTSMPQTNLLVSADHKGFAAYLLEKAFGSIAPFLKYGDFVAAFPNGAEGDLSPNLDTSAVTVFRGPDTDPFESTKIIGTREFNAAFGLFNSVQPEDIGSDVDYRHKFVYMPGTPVPTSNFTNGSGTKTLCAGAYGMSFMAGAEDGRTGMLSEGMALVSGFDKAALDATRVAAVATITALLPPLAAVVTPTSSEFMAASADQCQFPKPILLPTGWMHWSVDILPFQLFRIGSLAIAAIPGEMTVQAGRRLVDAIKSTVLPLGVTHVLLTGLANEYSGYITTPEEFGSQQYEGASTIFGRLTFDAYKEAFRDLGLAMAAGRTVGTAAAPGDLSVGQIEWTPDIDFDELPAGQSFGQVLLQPPAVVARGTGANVHIVYRSGNPRYDLRRNDTYFRIERDLGGGNWGLVAWDGTPDTRLYWNRSISVPQGGIGPQCPDPEKCYWSTIGVIWTLPADVTPGRYRIRVFGKWKNGVTNQLLPYEGTTNVFVVQ